MLQGINDSLAELKALKKLASKLGRVRINLIPYNQSDKHTLISAPPAIAEQWRDTLIKVGFITTIRHSQGQDIFAACGQLQNK